jgi:transposase-like protein
MHERGVPVDHTTVFRWVQRYVTELEKRSAVARRTDHARGVLRSPRD